MSIIPPTRLDIYLCSITITDFASIIICKKELNFTSTSTKLLKTPLYKGGYRGGGELFHFHLTSTFPNRRVGAYRQ